MTVTAWRSAILALVCVTLPTAGWAQGGGPLQQVTAEPGVDVDAVYTPDGQNVLFASSRSGSLELWMRPVSGGGMYQITSSSSGSADRNPSITPDGTVVIFQSDRVTGVRNIWGLTLANRGLVQLTSVSDGATNPAVSPDGSTICYTRAEQSGRLTVWTLLIDGRNPRELGPGFDCAWTPDGRRIVMARNSSTRENAPTYDLWIMDADGRNPRQIVSLPNAHERSPAVSPDGQFLVFTRYSELPSTDLEEVPGGFQVRQGLRTSLWIVPLDGSAPPRQLTDALSFNSYATWSPDGTRVLFTSTRSGSADLWSMPVR